MKSNEQYKRIVMFLTSAALLSALTAIFGYVWYQYYSDNIVQPFFRKGNWAVIALYALLLYLFGRLYGGFRVGYLRRGDVIYSGILSMLFANAIAYLEVSVIGRRFMAVVPVLGMSVVDTAVILLWAAGSDRLFARLFPPHRMLVVYGSRRAESLVYKMSTRSEKYDICEAVHADTGYEEIVRRIGGYDSVVICDVRSELRNELLKFCFQNCVRTYLTPKISDTIVRGAEVIHLFDTPLLLCRNTGLSPEQRFLKRALDLAVSTVAIAATLPIMAIVALAIHLYDGGPVLYRQERLTTDGRTFSICKFRSMVVDAERGGARLAAAHDARITPVGRFIRRVRLDELPQFFNIWRGDMSVVGPRPERPEIARQYERQMPEFSFRLKVKAGLTGYAQVLGAYNTTPYDKLKLDLMYIETYSLFLDIKLILKTIKILFVPESTQGIPNGTSTALDDPGIPPQEKR